MNTEQVQVRDDSGELKYFDRIDDAIEYAYAHNDTVWKVSFSRGDERVRLVRYYARNGNCFWVYEPLLGSWVDDDPDEPLFENPNVPHNG